MWANTHPRKRTKCQRPGRVRSNICSCSRNNAQQVFYSDVGDDERVLFDRRYFLRVLRHDKNKIKSKERPQEDHTVTGRHREQRKTETEVGVIKQPMNGLRLPLCIQIFLGAEL